MGLCRPVLYAVQCPISRMGVTISSSTTIQGNFSHVGGRGREVGGRLGEAAVGGGGAEAVASPTLGRSRKAVLKMLGEPILVCFLWFSFEITLY